MKLNSLQYSEYEDQDMEWKLDKFNVGQISLIVGKNSSGKTRTMNVLSGLASVLSGERELFHHGSYQMEFEDEQHGLFLYELEIKDQVILKEKVSRDGKELLVRSGDGSGQIFAEEENKFIKFQVPEQKLAALAKRDSLQHVFLEPLFLWADSLIHHRFNDNSEKATLIAFKEQSRRNKVSKFNPVGLLRTGLERYPNTFKSKVIQDMGILEYPIDDLGLSNPIGVEVIDGPPIYELYAKESNLNCDTHQRYMSDGMFRALALLIKLNYTILSGNSAILVVDDICEGLDFKRSTLLVEIVIAKCLNSNVQLLMSTNDQFVMNGVPLEYWTIASRSGSVVSLINTENAPDLFEKFKFIGLNNFEFFAEELYLTANNDA